MRKNPMIVRRDFVAVGFDQLHIFPSKSKSTTHISVQTNSLSRISGEIIVREDMAGG